MPPSQIQGRLRVLLMFHRLGVQQDRLRVRLAAQVVEHVKGHGRPQPDPPLTLAEVLQANSFALPSDERYFTPERDLPRETVPLFLGVRELIGPGRKEDEHVRITAPGYRAMEFDADIVSGEVLPYQGTLER